MLHKWLKLILENFKVIMSIMVLLGVSGVSIYGNVNELNPWKPVEELIEDEVSESAVPLPLPILVPQIKIIEKTIETRVESGITEQDVTNLLNTAMAVHIEEYH